LAQDAGNASTNATTEISQLYNITAICEKKACTTIFIEIINKTFTPTFSWHISEVNCTLSPLDTGSLKTSKHLMTCEFPWLNYSSQEEFEKQTIPWPVFLARLFENITVDYSELTSLRAQNPWLWFIIAAESIFIMGYFVWQRIDEGRGED